MKKIKKNPVIPNTKWIKGQAMPKDQFGHFSLVEEVEVEVGKDGPFSTGLYKDQFGHVQGSDPLNQRELLEFLFEVASQSKLSGPRRR